MRPPQSPVNGALIGLAAFACYACADVMVKFLGTGMVSVQVMFLSAAFTLPFILAQHVLAARRAGRGIAGTLALGASLKPVLPVWTWVRIGITLLGSALVTYTFTHLPIAQCYAIFFTMPLMITLLAWPLLGERIDPLRGLIILVGFAGVLIAVQPGTTPLRLAHVTAIGGAATGALNALILRKIGGQESSGVILVWPVVAQALGAGVLMPLVWTPLQPQAWVAGAILGILGSCGGLLIIAAYRRAPAIVVAPMQYSQILWASILTFFLFDEAPGSVTLAGIAVIIAAGMALLLAARRGSHRETAG